MNIGAINQYSLAFGTKHHVRRPKSRTQEKNMQIQKQLAEKASRVPEINDVYQNKIREIKAKDPSFKPNQKVAKRIEEMKKQKLSLFDSDTIKEALSTKERDTERVIQCINTLEKFRADELKKILSTQAGRNHVKYLITGVVPKSSIENSEILLRNLLFNIEYGTK